jgi:hypothetical protein
MHTQSCLCPDNTVISALLPLREVRDSVRAGLHILLLIDQAFTPPLLLLYHYRHENRAALASSLGIPRKRKHPDSSSSNNNANSSNNNSNDNSNANDSNDTSMSDSPPASPIATLAAAAAAAATTAAAAAPAAAVGSLEWRTAAGLGTGGARSAAFKHWEHAAQHSGTPAAAAAAELLLNNTARLTAAQGQRMLAETLTKYLRARVEPGEVSTVETVESETVLPLSNGCATVVERLEITKGGPPHLRLVRCMVLYCSVLLAVMHSV